MNAGWHPREELSALLDGELPDDVAERVEVHCLVCSACALELDAARFARRDLRYLPAVDPPAGFLEQLLTAPVRGSERETGPVRQRAGWWIGNAAVAITIGVVLVVTSAGGPASSADASMPVGEAVRQHAVVTAAVTASFDGSFDAPPRAATLGRPYVAPADLAGYRLVDAYDVNGGVQLLYERGSDGLSVFEATGSAPRASRVVDGHPVEVVSRDGLVLTIVGSDDDSAVGDAARQLGGSASGATRLRRACGEVLAGLSPAG
jgi:hypothetical protein